MIKPLFVALTLLPLIGAAPSLSLAADKIRNSVTNFNMSFFVIRKRFERLELFERLEP